METCDEHDIISEAESKEPKTDYLWGFSTDAPGLAVPNHAALICISITSLTALSCTGDGLWRSPLVGLILKMQPPGSHCLRVPLSEVMSGKVQRNQRSHVAALKVVINTFSRS